MPYRLNAKQWRDSAAGRIATISDHPGTRPDDFRFDDLVWIDGVRWQVVAVERYAIGGFYPDELPFAISAAT